jgi:formamidopyrimidine-DNA glycosylase
MPELPEVETVCRTLRRHAVGQPIHAIEVVQPALRWQVDVPSLQAARGRTITAVRRRAKYILIDLAGAKGQQPMVLAVHLGMSGILRVLPPKAPKSRHDHVVLTLGQGATQIRFNDPRRFGSVHSFAASQELAHPLLAHLGPEPLDGDAFDGAYLHAQCRASSRCIKHVIMDGRVVVGVGNIYASEALWRSGISPRMAARRLSRPRAARLVQAIVDTLEDAIGQGGTTLRDFRDANAEAGHFGQRLKVYNRASLPCEVCATLVRRIVQGNRATFFCGGCQKA